MALNETGTRRNPEPLFERLNRRLRRDGWLLGKALAQRAGLAGRADP